MYQKIEIGWGSQLSAQDAARLMGKKLVGIRASVSTVDLLYEDDLCLTLAAGYEGIEVDIGVKTDIKGW